MPRAQKSKADTRQRSGFGRERRDFALTDLDVLAEGKVKRLTGHAAVFNSLSERLMWGFREKIAPGAFRESIENDDIVALWSHNTGMPLGRKSANTLTLREDETGLAVEILPGGTTWGRDAHKAVERGDVNRMSFGFEVQTDEWNTIEGEEVRTIKKAKVFEVSPVVFPAYTATDISARAIGAVEVRELAGAYERLRSGTASEADADIIRRAAQELSALVGPTPLERQTQLFRQRRLRLADA